MGCRRGEIRSAQQNLHLPLVLGIKTNGIRGRLMKRR
jgi:hypothetical protein